MVSNGFWRGQTQRKSSVPNGIRTRVLALKGPRPRPLDDGDVRSSAAATSETSNDNRRSRLRQRPASSVASRRGPFHSRIHDPRGRRLAPAPHDKETRVSLAVPDWTDLELESGAKAVDSWSHPYPTAGSGMRTLSSRLRGLSVVPAHTTRRRASSVPYRCFFGPFSSSESERQRRARPGSGRFHGCPRTRPARRQHRWPVSCEGGHSRGPSAENTA